MNANDIYRICANHGLVPHDCPEYPGEVMVRCKEGHPWAPLVVAEKYAREPFGCPYCLGEIQLPQAKAATS